MNTLRLFFGKFESVTPSTAWYLTDLAEARGKQELYIRQSPQRLRTLREHALIESAVSSNRIEGVEVDKSRIATLIFGKPLLRDRDEEEVRGYRQALTLIHEQGTALTISEETILKFHRLARGEIWDAGKYKEKDSDIIEKISQWPLADTLQNRPCRENTRLHEQIGGHLQRQYSGAKGSATGASLGFQSGFLVHPPIP